MRRPFSCTRAPGRGRVQLPGRGERVVQVALSTPEREVLVHLLGQLDELLDDGRPADEDPLVALTGMSGSFDDDRLVTAPRDPALARLLPDGNTGDPALAEEYRRLTEYGLRSRKQESARAAIAALRRPEPVLMVHGEALGLLKSLTDLRLVLGERLELRTDEDAEALHERLLERAEQPDGQDWAQTANLYEVLTYWQECLVDAVSRVEE